jgi:hypothetical protein
MLSLVKKVRYRYRSIQGFGSGLDPDLIRSLDPDPYSESGSGSRRGKKICHKNLDPDPCQKNTDPKPW